MMNERTSEQGQAAETPFSSLAFRLPTKGVDLLTGLAVLDDTSVGDQVRDAVTAFLDQDESIDTTFQVRSALQAAEVTRPITVNMPQDRYKQLIEKANTQGTKVTDLLISAVHYYVLLRQNHPDFNSEVTTALAQYKPKTQA